MKKVICMGESLIDFLPSGNEMQYVAKAGGAPSNVCACVAKLGGRGYYLGKMSRDGFSRFLIKSMQNAGVNTDFVVFDERYNTALAVVSLSDDGDREFSFYRNNTSDVMLDKSEIKSEMFESGDILHFCSVGLVESPSKYAHKQAIDFAIQNGALISFDVNVRFGLWDSRENCKNTIVEFLKFADIVKVTDEELAFITDKEDELGGVKKIFEYAECCKILFVTKGKNGASVYDRKMTSFDREAVNVKVVDTTGAGDCFSGCILYAITCENAKLDINSMKNAVDFASFGCGVVIGKKGAMEAMPTQQDILELRNKVELCNK